MSSRKNVKLLLIFFWISFLIKIEKRIDFLVNSGIIFGTFGILFSVHIIAHLPFIGRRSNEGACVEQAPFALFIVLFPVFGIFFH